jgi:hypothetical protein
VIPGLLVLRSADPAGDGSAVMRESCRLTGLSSQQFSALQLKTQALTDTLPGAFQPGLCIMLANATFSMSCCNDP